MAIHVVVAPYTKVEEIFQVNNIYDHLYLMDDVKNYDFVEFPGVVYRTFISSLMIAAIDFPFKYLMKPFGFTCFHMLVLSRLTLGFLNFLSLKFMRRQVHLKYRDQHVTNAFFMVSSTTITTILYVF
jgi:hypothetical protein